MGFSEPVSASLIKEVQRNQPNGFLGIKSDGTVDAILAHRSLTIAGANAIIPALGELIYITDYPELRIGDGSTTGGIFLSSPARRYGSSTATSIGLDPSVFPISYTIPLTQGVYRLETNFYFSGDTDNLSNFKVRFGNPNSFGWQAIDNLTAANFGTTESRGNLRWNAKLGASIFESGFIPIQSYNTSVNGIHADTTQSNGYLSQTVIFALAGFAGNKSIAQNMIVYPTLRTTPIGTPNIVVKGGIVVQKIGQ